MSFRKRKISPDIGTERTPSKRAKLLSSLWKAQEETVGTTQESQKTSSSPLYRIKAIIGERSDEYLIDWADDPITGERFKPDWVSKDIRHAPPCLPYIGFEPLFASLVGTFAPTFTLH